MMKTIKTGLAAIATIAFAHSALANGTYPGKPDGWHPPMAPEYKPPKPVFKPQNPLVPDFIEKRKWEEQQFCKNNPDVC